MAHFHVGLQQVIDHSYDISIGRDLISELIGDLEIYRDKRYKIAVLTDSCVHKLYGESFMHRLTSEGFHAEMFVIPEGETSKTRETKQWIEDEMLCKGFGRDSCIVAFGGGMITDLAGFVASTYCRGIPYVNYATTLLSAADASIGGKTAVNTPVATNMIGAFHQPRKVYIDLDTWSTLPIRQIKNGLAETIIHACIADAEFFTYLEEHMYKLITSAMDEAICEHIAYTNCKIKYQIVEQDEKEENLRQILNLGHTAGRAIETLSNYDLFHGEAVAVGLMVQAHLACKLGFLPVQTVHRIQALFDSIQLSTRIPQHLTPSMILRQMYTDKKVRQDKIHFVLMEGIGNIKLFEGNKYSVAIDDDILLDTLQALKLY